MDRVDGYALCGITSSNSKVKAVLLRLSCCNQSKFGKVQEKKGHWNICVVWWSGGGGLFFLLKGLDFAKSLQLLLTCTIFFLSEHQFFKILKQSYVLSLYAFTPDCLWTKKILLLVKKFVLIFLWSSSPLMKSGDREWWVAGGCM